MKTLKIAALSLALIASLFLLDNVTKAATAEVNLRINGTAGSCVYGTISNLGTTGFSFAAQTMTGAFTGTAAPGGATRWCFDSSGAASWNLAMVMSGDIINMTNPIYKIASGNVAYANHAVHEQAGSGDCTSITGASASMTDWKTLNGSQKVLEKLSALGEICRVQTTGLQLRVNIPAGTNVGSYSGQLVITLPGVGF